MDVAWRLVLQSRFGKMSWLSKEKFQKLANDAKGQFEKAQAAVTQQVQAVQQRTASQTPQRRTSQLGGSEGSRGR